MVEGLKVLEMRASKLLTSLKVDLARVRCIFGHIRRLLATRLALGHLRPPDEEFIGTESQVVVAQV